MGKIFIYSGVASKHRLLERVFGRFMIELQSGKKQELKFSLISPCERLKKYVLYYWVLDKESCAYPTEEFMIPDGLEEIIFSYSGSYTRSEIINGVKHTPQAVSHSYVTGCKLNGVTCVGEEGLSMVGIKFWPQSLYTLLRLPLDHFGNKVISLTDLQNRFLLDLEMRVHEVKDNLAALKSLLDKTLSYKLLNEEKDDIVSFVSRHLYHHEGRIAVGELSDRANCHIRTLERKYKRQVGVSPKRLARTLRFKNLFQKLSSHEQIDLHSHGYFDQSHFIKEFKQFSGKTPTQFFGSHNPFSMDVTKFCIDFESTD